ncbi:hypothetical protein [Ralstonia solanacearum]|uniref:hypothetical protein n=1 Tax=Ralstonia solanacearum TaxID=305 RepID=UPI0012FE6847|nr:hypothetical protein [Ralstonia solanacearum]
MTEAGADRKREKGAAAEEKGDKKSHSAIAPVPMTAVSAAPAAPALKLAAPFADEEDWSTF